MRMGLIKDFIKNIDQKYLAGFVKRVVRGKPVIKIELTSEEKKIIHEEVIRQTRLPVPSERDTKQVEIIVLKYKDPEIEVRCAQEIIENTDWPYKLTFYDNRLGTKNLAKIWNKLIRESTCDYVLLLNTDAFVPKLKPCWLTRMMQTFDIPGCAVVLPRVTKTSCSQQRSEVAEEKEPEKMTMIFAYQCILFKKDIFEQVGYLDEEFLLHGQDSEWAYRLLQSQYSAYLRPDVLVEHLGHYSIKKAERNKELYGIVESQYALDLFNKKTKYFIK